MSKNYTAEIIAVGTELLLGQIANTNAQWISEKLADMGIHVYHHSVVGDNIDRVHQVFQQAADRADIVFVTGGLGPTDDDLTREAFQKMTDFKVVEDKESMERIESFFKKANRNMTSNNRKQSLVFENAFVFSNKVGMAPGMGVSFKGVQWFFMPGVPREMKSIMEEEITPFLRTLLPSSKTIKSRMLRFIGIGESQLEHDLKPLIEKQSNPTIAPLATEGEVGLRLTAKAENEEEAVRMIEETEKKVLEKTGRFFYGYDEDTLNGKIVQLLRSKGLRIAAAESLTGGKFADGIISVPGASAIFQGSVVAYAPETKINILQISPEVIETDGTVSEQCALEMAANVKRLLHADVGISFTGVAGPGLEEEKQPGTVYIALSFADGTEYVHPCQFFGDRQAVRNKAVKKGMQLLWDFVSK